MKIGLIWVGYQCEDLLSASLQPWVEARAGRLDGHEFVICAVSVPFKGFEQPTVLDRTLEILGVAHLEGKIDHRIESEVPVTEVDARGRALRWLVDHGCELIWQHDSDELITTDQIAAITTFVQTRPHTAWFRLCLRNVVFTPTTYLVEPFTPPRIHRVLVGPYKAAGFWDDNNVVYNGTVTRDRKMDTHFASVTVPKTVAFVKHLTWLSDLRSKKKVEYQRLRWGACSFKWSDDVGLSFDVDYFQSRGETLPEISVTDVDGQERIPQV